MPPAAPPLWGSPSGISIKEEETHPHDAENVGANVYPAPHPPCSFFQALMPWHAPNPLHVFDPVTLSSLLLIMALFYQLVPVDNVCPPLTSGLLHK